MCAEIFQWTVKLCFAVALLKIQKNHEKGYIFFVDLKIRFKRSARSEDEDYIASCAMNN